jgi:hypothetical protein
MKPSLTWFSLFGCFFNVVGESGVLASRERSGIGYGKNETHIAEFKYSFSLD